MHALHLLVSRLRVAMCRVSAHTWPSSNSLSIYHQLAFEIWSQHDVCFSPSKAKTRTNVSPARRLQRDPPAPPAVGATSPAGVEAGVTCCIVPYSRTHLAILLTVCRSTTKLHLKHSPNTMCDLASVNPKRAQTCHRHGAFSGTLRHLRRATLTSEG